MSQSVIPVPPAAWIDITDQATWHADMFAQRLWYNPALRMVMGSFRVNTLANNGAPFTALAAAYRPAVQQTFGGTCTNTDDNDAHFAYMTVKTDGSSLVQFIQNKDHARVTFSVMWPCA